MSGPLGAVLFLEKVDADEHHRLAALIFRPMRYAHCDPSSSFPVG
jgi:hypothetical protein